MKTRYLFLFVFLFAQYLSIAQNSFSPKSPNEDIRKNNIYLEIMGNGYFYSLSYDRLIPLDERIICFLRVGGLLTPYKEEDNHLIILGEAGILIGGSKHYIDLGVGYTNIFLTDLDQLIPFRIGYRYQGSKGLVIRLAPMYLKLVTAKEIKPKIDFWAGLSIGYSFQFK